MDNAILERNDFNPQRWWASEVKTGNKKEEKGGRKSERDQYKSGKKGNFKDSFFVPFIGPVETNTCTKIKIRVYAGRKGEKI